MTDIYLNIKPSTNKSKKYDAFFSDGTHHKKISFGASGYLDFTIGATEQQKNNYLNRHQKREDWTTPFSAGSLSAHLLWDTNNIKTNIKKFKKKFDLK